MHALGLDIGGANLKAAHSIGVARVQPFALWKHPTRLADELRAFVAQMPAADAWAVTMTGELCDCYSSKREGVLAILAAVEAVAGPTPVQVWTVDGRFVRPDEARLVPLRVAAVNWHALATFAGRFAPVGTGVLIDAGSTTTDIIPLERGVPVPRGHSDVERLRSGELVYTGIRRTPLCALLDDVAAEFFATSLDAYLVLGHIPEAVTDRDTADGQPATQAAAHLRLARMLGADLETSAPQDREALARRVLKRQCGLIGEGLRAVVSRLVEPPRTMVLSGSGEFLARLAIERLPDGATPRPVSLAGEVGADASQAACAHALAVLATERAAAPPFVVVKVGGSLYDLPDLGRRLEAWLNGLRPACPVLVPGGGPTANAIRQLDQWQGLGEDVSHWLALASLVTNATFLASVLTGGVIVRDLAELEHFRGDRGRWPILDMHAFGLADEARPGALPHCWTVTSDSLAARVAQVIGASELVLLKSVDMPPGMSWQEAAREGIVDDHFANLTNLPRHVRVVNLRRATE